MMAGTSDGDGGRLGSVATMVGWIGAGALLVAAGALAVDATLTVPLSRAVLVGLGIALGGGIGAVGYLLTADDIEESESDRETMTVEMDEDAIPEPVDLFDGHPDPILYYADQGYGPVVRAANEAFGATFDVPPGRIAGTPLEETLMLSDSDAVETDAITDATFETTVDCTTGDGTRRFRLRSIDVDGDGYLLYTPLD